MAANPTPTNDQKLIAQCEGMVIGCKALEEELGVKQNTAEVMQTALDAARIALENVKHLKKERKDCREELRLSDVEGERVIGLCRLRMVAIFGPTFNEQWAAVGFPDSSTQVPEVQAKRISLLTLLAAYFTCTPDHQSSDMAATASICLTTYDSLIKARSAVNDHKPLLAAAVKTKNAAMLALRRRSRNLIHELSMLLPPTDRRWRQFGLNVPALDPVPKPVGKVTLTAKGQGMVQAQWAASPFATIYHLQTRIMGSKAFETVASGPELQVVLKELASGQFIEARVIAANDEGEAKPSPAAAVAVG